MEDKKDFSVSFIPDNSAIWLVLLIIGSFWAKLFLRRHTLFIYKFFSYLFVFNFIITFYFLYYFFVYSKIIISENKIVFPNTSYSGMPLALIFQKKVIDIQSITKIIKHPVKHDGCFVPSRLTFHSAKILIIAKGMDNIQLSYGFYGGEQIERLIQEILIRNENVQIV